MAKTQYQNLKSPECKSYSQHKYYNIVKPMKKKLALQCLQKTSNKITRQIFVSLHFHFKIHTEKNSIH